MTVKLYVYRYPGSALGHPRRSVRDHHPLTRDALWTTPCEAQQFFLPDRLHLHSRLVETTPGMLRCIFFHLKEMRLEWEVVHPENNVHKRTPNSKVQSRKWASDAQLVTLGLLPLGVSVLSGFSERSRLVCFVLELYGWFMRLVWFSVLPLVSCFLGNSCLLVALVDVSWLLSIALEQTFPDHWISFQKSSTQTSTALTKFLPKWQHNLENLH